MNSDTVVEKLTDWAKEFDPEFYDVLVKDPAYTKAVFAIDRDCAKPRKDIAKWNEAKDYCAYFFSELYTPEYLFPENIAPEDVKAFLEKYIEVCNNVKSVFPDACISTDIIAAAIKAYINAVNKIVYEEA